MQDYIDKAISGTKPLWAFIVGVINYVLFPDKALLIAFYSVGIAIVLDIVTKYRAIGKKHGGLKNARKLGYLLSRKLWEGTKDKLFTYFIIFIFAGLSYRITDMNIFQQASLFLTSVAYLVIFLREFQSCLENLDEAGSDVSWLLLWTKKKQQQILESEITDQLNERTDYNERI